MDLLNKDQLWSLMEVADEACVSIYLPTHSAGDQIQQDPIRLKNLLRIAEEKLTESGMRSTAAKDLLEPARVLLDDDGFWRHGTQELAIFVAPGFFRYYRLPVEFKELVVVTGRFHIKPLLSLLLDDGSFYILALSQKRVRLLRGTRHSVEELDIGELAAGLDEVLGYDEPERRLQMHSGREGRRGRQAAIFHGHGDEGIDDTKDNLFRYFRRIDKGLRERFPHDGMPWVLAGVDYLLPIYREASDNHQILTEGVEGNPDKVSARQLHDAAWESIGPLFRRAQEEAEAKYRERAGTGLASSELDEVVPAAYHGRMESLFVALGVQRWGRFDADSNVVEEHAEPEPGDRDLLDLAALRTLMNGGSVFAVDPDGVPADNGSPAAAVFRY